MDSGFLMKKYGIVLAGGGAKGAYEMGAIKALSEIGILDNAAGVAGTSIGAVNLVLLASRDMDNAEKVWKNINVDDFIDIDDDNFDTLREHAGVLSREGLRRLLKENGSFTNVKNSDIPQYITVSLINTDDTYSVRYIKLNGKDESIIEDYIIASSAIPVVYEAVGVEGAFYQDGGLCDNTPIKPLYDEGIRDIVVISNDPEYIIPATEFPEANIMLVSPSAPIYIDSILATGDLNKYNAVYRFELGYYDAKLSLPYLLKGEKVPDLSGNKTLAQQSYYQTRLASNVADNMSSLENMLGKYGIDL